MLSLVEFHGVLLVETSQMWLNEQTKNMPEVEQPILSGQAEKKDTWTSLVSLLSQCIGPNWQDGWIVGYHKTFHIPLN